jgi:hypothetical protein
MIFAQKVLTPGPGICPKATFRWRPFQSALSGSLFFIPPDLPKVMIFYMIFFRRRGKFPVKKHLTQRPIQE